MIRYLLDENVHPLYRTKLLKRNPDIVVRMVGGIAAPPLQTLDPEILNWCEDHDFILITNNRKSMPLLLQIT
ncbi:MAG: DUF5615 family PIN-like protein [Herpetosiphon sp.]|nr:DUF5615 family PIN-like protein [Herpetosiphon sp.]